MTCMVDVMEHNLVCGISLYIIIYRDRYHYGTTKLYHTTVVEHCYALCTHRFEHGVVTKTTAIYLFHVLM